MRLDSSQGVTCSDKSELYLSVVSAACDALVGDGLATTKPAPRVDRRSGVVCKAALLGRLDVT